MNAKRRLAPHAAASSPPRTVTLSVFLIYGGRLNIDECLMRAAPSESFWSLWSADKRHNAAIFKSCHGEGSSVQ